jgi:hypothetical protein
MVPSKSKSRPSKERSRGGAEYDCCSTVDILCLYLLDLFWPNSNVVYWLNKTAKRILDVEETKGGRQYNKGQCRCPNELEFAFSCLPNNAYCLRMVEPPIFPQRHQL